jgi:hypothetical protein
MAEWVYVGKGFVNVIHTQGKLASQCVRSKPPPIFETGTWDGFLADQMASVDAIGWAMARAHLAWIKLSPGMRSAGSVWRKDSP